MNDNAFSVVGSDQQDVIISPCRKLACWTRDYSGSDGSDKIQVALYRRAMRDGREQWDSAGNVTTRADGQFRLAELSPGDYKLLTLEQLDRDPLTAFPRGALFGYPPLLSKRFTPATAVIKLVLETFQATMSPAKRAYYPVNLGFTNPLANGVAVTVWPEGHPGPGYSLAITRRKQPFRVPCQMALTPFRPASTVRPGWRAVQISRSEELLPPAQP